MGTRIARTPGPGGYGAVRRARVDQTTVAEIAAAAGLTERTFFRYFIDKREVLFWGQDALREGVVGAVVAAAESASPIEAAIGAVKATAAFFGDAASGPRTRNAIISAHAELRERELLKLASLSSAIAEALRGRGVEEPAASLAAETGVAVFKVAFERWIGCAEPRNFAEVVRETFENLKVMTAGG